MSRKFNFHAGPSTLPVEVLEELQKNMVDFQGTGLSLIEESHRSANYEAVHNGAVDLFREMFSVPANYRILFLGGGGTLQFAMVPDELPARGKDRRVRFHRGPGRRKRSKTRRNWAASRSFLTARKAGTPRSRIRPP